MAIGFLVQNSHKSFDKSLINWHRPLTKSNTLTSEAKGTFNVESLKHSQSKTI